MEGVGVEGCTVNPLAIEKGGLRWWSEPKKEWRSQLMTFRLMDLQLLEKIGSLSQKVTPKLYSRTFFLVLGYERERERAIYRWSVTFMH